MKQNQIDTNYQQMVLVITKENAKCLLISAS